LEETMTGGIAVTVATPVAQLPRAGWVAEPLASRPQQRRIQEQPAGQLHPNARENDQKGSNTVSEGFECRNDRGARLLASGDPIVCRMNAFYTKLFELLRGDAKWPQE
jgi:hypothetical protein